MEISENGSKDKKPRTNFANCVGEPVTLFLRDADQLGPLDLPAKAGQVEGRLVGVERQGVWFEPKAWLDSATESEDSVPHVFLLWENVLSLVRKVDSSEFAQKKQYRGLRPRS